MRLGALVVGVIGSFFDIKWTIMSYAFKMCCRQVTSTAIGPLKAVIRCCYKNEVKISVISNSDVKMG